MTILSLELLPQQPYTGQGTWEVRQHNIPHALTSRSVTLVSISFYGDPTFSRPYGGDAGLVTFDWLVPRSVQWTGLSTPLSNEYRGCIPFWDKIWAVTATTAGGLTCAATYNYNCDLGPQQIPSHFTSRIKLPSHLDPSQHKTSVSIVFDVL